MRRPKYIRRPVRFLYIALFGLLYRNNRLVLYLGNDVEWFLSSRELTGYRIAAQDGNIGKVDDFVIDDQMWLLHYLVIDTSNWLPGDSVLVAVGKLKDVVWGSEEVGVDMTKEQIEGAPKFNPSAPINRKLEIQPYDFYGRRADPME